MIDVFYLKLHSRKDKEYSLTFLSTIKNEFVNHLKKSLCQDLYWENPEILRLNLKLL